MTDFIDQIICGDCLEVMPTIPDKSVDMILADLPYGVTACKWDTPLPLDELWKQFERISKPNASIVFTATQPFTTTLISSNMNQFRYEWIWDKQMSSNFQLSHQMPLKVHENILIFSKERGVYNPQMTKRKGPLDTRSWAFKKPGVHDNCNSHEAAKRIYTHYFPKSIFSYSSVANECNGANRLITTQKPVALFEYLIRTYTNEGDTVLDPTAGSGTTAVACRKSNRHYICIEKEPEYCKIAEKRLAEML